MSPASRFRSMDIARLRSRFYGVVVALTASACAAAEPSDDVGVGSSELQEVCGGFTTVHGIDVSRYQADVTWSKVKASGQTFAFARVSDGTTHLDAKFVQNWRGMKSAGLIR